MCVRRQYTLDVPASERGKIEAAHQLCQGLQLSES